MERSDAEKCVDTEHNQGVKLNTKSKSVKVNKIRVNSKMKESIYLMGF